jgi:choline/ethanolamine kinase
LQTRELSDPVLSRLVAQKLAQIHMMDVPINKEPRWLWDTMYRYRLQIDQLFGVIELVTKHSRSATHLTSVSCVNDLAILCALQKLIGELLNL